MESELKLYDTKLIKGFAVFLMILHHLWKFPGYLYHGDLFSFFGTDAMHRMGDFGKICVSIFFFVGGYGLYELSKRGKFNPFVRIKKIYIAYWKVFLIIIPIAFFFFNDSYFPEKLYDDQRFITIFLNFFSLSASYLKVNWFILSYFCAIITFPFLKKYFDKHSFLKNLVVVIIFSILSCSLFPSLGNSEIFSNLNKNFLFTYFIYNVHGGAYYSCFWMGMIFSKDNVFKIMNKKMNEAFPINFFSSLIIFSLCYVMREFYFYEFSDVILVPFVIMSSLYIIKRIRILEKIFEAFGNQSFNMWFVHIVLCWFFYPFTRIVVSPVWCFSSLVLLLVMTYIFSLGIDAFWKKIGELYKLVVKE